MTDPDLLRQAIAWGRVLVKECQKELNQLPNNHNRAAAQLNTVLNGVLYRNLKGVTCDQIQNSSMKWM